MITRKQLIDFDGSREERERMHRAYYAQFLTPALIDHVRRAVTLERILKSEDPHFNDVPLHVWDAVFYAVPADVDRKIREAGDYPTLAGMVCLAREAARQIRERDRGRVGAAPAPRRATTPAGEAAHHAENLEPSS